MAMNRDLKTTQHAGMNIPSWHVQRLAGESYDLGDDYWGEIAEQDRQGLEEHLVLAVLLYQSAAPPKGASMKGLIRRSFPGCRVFWSQVKQCESFGRDWPMISSFIPERACAQIPPNVRANTSTCPTQLLAL